MKIKKALEQADARLLLDSALSSAAEMKGSFSIAIVDDGGFLLTSARMDGAGLMTPDVAIKKARTSAFMRCPSRILADRAGQDVTLLSLTDYLPMAGGLPINVDGQLVGAIGVSGGTPDQDESVGQAAIDRLLSA